MQTVNHILSYVALGRNYLPSLGAIYLCFLQCSWSGSSLQLMGDTDLRVSMY